MAFLTLISLLLLPDVAPLAHVDSLTEELRSPARVCVGLDGTVYVTDPFANQIARYDSAGAFLGTWSVPEGPLGVGVHPDGRILVSLRDEGQVGIYTDGGAALTRIGTLDGGGIPVVSFDGPTDIEIDAATGRVYVVDAEGDDVYGFESDDSLAVKFGIRGEGNGQFMYPSAIAYDAANDRLIVADHDNFRGQVFNTSGVFQRRFGFRLIYLPGGVQEGWMPRTQGLAIDSAGRMYIADALMCAVRILDSDGTHLGKVVTYGVDSGDVRTPCDLALSPDGLLLYVVSTNTSSVEVYQTPAWGGKMASSLHGGGAPGTNWSLLDASRWLTPMSRGVPGGIRSDTRSDYEGPHMIEATIICGRCHGITAQPGDHVGTLEGQNVLCFSCHSSGGQALSMPMHELDIADPFGSNPNATDGRGISHAWGVPAVNAAADSVGPNAGGEMERYLDGGGLIKCATCHNQHSNDAGSPYMRVANTHDAMCKECHSPRDEGLGERGTHAVGFDYPGGVGEFPADGAISPMVLDEGMVECKTCHGVHNASSGGANGGEGDGMLLRAANDESFCKTCHTEHVGHSVGGAWQPTCSDCHDVHDPDSANLALVAASIYNQTLGLDKPVVFIAQSGANSFDDEDPAANDGVCQVCHTATNYHLHDGTGASHYGGQNCTACHPHADGFQPTGGDCTSCHGQPPDSLPPIGDVFPNRAGSHATHMSAANGPGIASCFDCHATFGGTHLNGQVSFASGVDSNGDSNIDLAETDTCDACHGPDGPLDGVNDAVIGAKANWADGVYDGDSLLAGKESWCAGCHDTGSATIDGVNAPPVAGDNASWGYFTSGHGRSGVVSCTDCHDTTSAHTDGVAGTYQASNDNYQSGFRLKSVNGGPPMIVPRTGFDWDDAYDDPPYWELCFSCHNKYALLGGPTAPAGPYYSDEFGTNFRSDASVIIPDGLDTDIAGQSMTGAADFNAHYAHLAGPPHFYDSDQDGSLDSYGACVACHNVHGGVSPAMVRDGKLIGVEPALNFSYVRYDRHDPPIGGCADPIMMTSDGPVALSESQGGVMRANGGPAANGVCNFCHGGGGGTGDPEYAINCYDPDMVDYYRTPILSISGCGTCHSTPVDNGDGVPAGGRRAVIGEFPAGDTHAHYGAELSDDACVVCHDMTTHMDGFVDLIDADSGGLYRFVIPGDLASDPDLSDFCTSCHDADGAARLPTPTDPFDSGNVVPDVASKFLGTLQWTEWYGDGCLGEEGTLRGVNSHHDISDADQAFSGAKLECLNCHGSHSAGASQPLVDPFDTTVVWAGGETDFCLACHYGGAGPLDPGFPPGVTGPTNPMRGLDSCDYGDQPWYVDYTWTNSAHGPNSKRGWVDYSGAPSHVLDCTVCHDPHGSYTLSNPAGNPYMINDFVDGTPFVDDGYRGGSNWTGPPWDTYGVARAVEIPVSGLDVGWGGPTGLCQVCHADWINAQHYHDYCTSCQTCHGHGQLWGEYDWGASPEDDTPCPPDVPRPLGSGGDRWRPLDPDAVQPPTHLREEIPFD